MILTAGAPPIFLSKPWVNKDADDAGQIVASSMQSLAHRIYQLDPTATWQGTAGEDDTKTETITIGIYSGSAQAAVTLDTFLILNNNLDDFLLEYCTDYAPGTAGVAGTGTWQTVANVVGNAGTDYRLIRAPIASVNGLRLTMTTTQNAAGTGANQQKFIGNFIPALSAFQLSSLPSDITPTPIINRVDLVLADKSLDSMYMDWSDNSFALWEVDFEYPYAQISAADKNSLDSLFLSPAPFLVYPEPGDTPRDVYLALFDPKSYFPGYSRQSTKSQPQRFKIREVGYL